MASSGQAQQVQGDHQQDAAVDRSTQPVTPDPEERRKLNDPRRKRTIRFIVLALIVVAAIAAVPVFAYYAVRESTDDAQVDGHIIPVSPRVAGTVTAVLVDDNQRVSAGQELVRLDPADYQVALDQAQAQLSNAEATTTESQVNVPLTNINTRSQVSTSTTQADQSAAALAAAQQAVNAARARLESANASVTEKQANAARAQKDLARFKSLVDKDEISKQDYDAAIAAAQSNSAQVESSKADEVEAQHNLDQSIAQVDEAKARLAAAVIQRRQSEQLRPRQAEVSEARFKQAQAQVKQNEASLSQAKLNLGYTVVRAKVDGIVSRKTVEPGMQVTPGQQIMTLVPLDDVWVTANFKETQLRKMRAGQRVQIEVDTFGGGHKYMGHLDSVAAASGAKFSLLPPENATGNYVKVVQRIPVKIVLEPGENRDRRLLPGMSVVPTVLLNSDSQ